MQFDYLFFFLMIRRPPRSTQSRSSAASDVYKRQEYILESQKNPYNSLDDALEKYGLPLKINKIKEEYLSLIHISEPTRPY